ncbi:hypothetical protein JXA80_05400 [bacterium]|nr:hypothetical protein [candidate division CSSED10-310 bacterium]
MKEQISSFIVCFSACILGFASPAVTARTIWVCQYCEPYMHPNTDSINAALALADPGDTVCIVAEENPVASADIIQYAEHIVLDKPVTLTCTEHHPVLGPPILTLTTFDGVNEVIHVTDKAAGAVISNLRIQGPPTDNTPCVGNPLDHRTKRAGIRIDAAGTSVKSCIITHCMTGIVISADAGVSIVNCTIGDRWIDTISGMIGIEEHWTDSHNGQPIRHPGNGFGIVVLPVESPANGQKKDRIDSPHCIRETTIRSSRYNSLVIPDNAGIIQENNQLEFNKH